MLLCAFEVTIIWWDTNWLIIIYFVFLKPTSTKPLGGNIKAKHRVMARTGVSLGNHGILEGDRVPSLYTMDRRWNRYVVSLDSSVILLMSPPITCVSSIAMSCHVPVVLLLL